MSQAAELVIVAAAVLTALGVIAAKLRPFVRAAVTAVRLVNNELDPGTSSESLRTDVHGLTVGMGLVQRTQDELVAAMRRQHPEDPMFWKDKRP